MKRRILTATLLAALSLAPVVAADGAAVYRAMGLDKSDVLSGTILSAKIIDGSRKQTVGLVTYLTGSKDKADAINVRLEVLDEAGGELVSRYSRDFGEAYGGYVADGDLLVLDIDADGLSEIIVSFDSHKDPLIQQRMAEITLRDESGFKVGWFGPVEYDATKSAREIPEERRDRYIREFDFANTLRTRGVTLFMNKKVIAVAGARLAEPKVVQETFSLRPKPRYR